MLEKEIEAFNLLFAGLNKACRSGIFDLMEAKQIADAAQTVADHLNQASEPIDAPDMPIQSDLYPAIASPPLPQTIREEDILNAAEPVKPKRNR